MFLLLFLILRLPPRPFFVRPVILESPPPRMDKGKEVMEGEVPFNP
jgi:hypothetical protein